MSQPTIGILGGMGPRATVAFEQRLIDAFSGADQAIPRIVSINNGNIPDRTAFLVHKGPDPLPHLQEGAQFLLAAGAGIICMPCNTAHAAQIVGRLQTTMPFPLLDMPVAALRQAERLGLSKVLILGTRGTQVAEVYVSRSRVVVCSFPDESDQTTIDEIIQAIKQNTLDNTQRLMIQSLVEHYEIDGIILACTELSMLKGDFTNTNVAVIDALDALIDSCVSFTRSYNKTDDKEKS